MRRNYQRPKLLQQPLSTCYDGYMVNNNNSTGISIKRNLFFFVFIVCDGVGWIPKHIPIISKSWASFIIISHSHTLSHCLTISLDILLTHSLLLLHLLSYSLSLSLFHLRSYSLSLLTLSLAILLIPSLALAPLPFPVSNIVTTVKARLTYTLCICPCYFYFHLAILVQARAVLPNKAQQTMQGE